MEKNFLKNHNMFLIIDKKTPCDKNKLFIDEVEENVKQINNKKFIVVNEKVNLNTDIMEHLPKEVNYSELSRKLTTKIDKNEKKNNGIYFTPPETIYKNIKILEPFMKNINTVLEPSCGSCEYILRLNSVNPGMNITGVELNETIFESIKQYERENILLLNKNYLTHDFTPLHI